jgi:hypothetical protein
VGKASRTRRRAAAVKARRTRSGSPVWYVATAAVIVVGVVAIALSRGETAGEARPLPNDDHWHSALGVNVCGTWLGNVPTFEERAGTTIRAGLHSHGDGLMHIHPYTSDEAGDRATLGQFLEEGGWSASGDSLELWDGTEHRDGQDCDGKEATVRWSVNGEERDGNPSDFKPNDGDVVALAFLPEGEDIGTPPQASAVPNDVEPSAQTTLPNAPETTTPGSTAPGETTVPGATVPETTAPATTVPATTVPASTAPPPTSAP